MSLESFVPKFSEWFARVTNRSATKEVKEHEEAVGNDTGFESLLKARVGDVGGLEVAEFGLCLEHPDDVSSDGFFDEAFKDRLGHFYVGN